MKNKKCIVFGLCALGLLGTGAFIGHVVKTSENNAAAGNLTDDAFLALIKNDQVAFERFIAAGGDMHASLPLIDGKIYTVAEGLSYFERPGFVKFLQSKKISFIKANKNRAPDILSLAIPKNNPELLELYLKEKPSLTSTYGDNEWGLLHLSSVYCSQKLAALLHEKGGLRWDLEAKDGSTPLTLAAEHDCLPVLSYWKEEKADFKARDGKGRTALSILKKKKDAALLAFADSFEVRVPAAAPTPAERPVISFYKKRIVPKDKVVDHTALVEPEARPIESVETADFSEFAD